jgi:GNAT superfamily N-acetyltransferase
MTEEQLQPYRIRNAGPSDLAVVRQISADAYISAYLPVLGYIPKPAEEDYGPRIARKEVWLLERSGRAVGVAVLEEHSDYLLVYSIAVNPTEQRQGHGRALLAFAGQRAVALPTLQIMTPVWQAAIDLPPVIWWSHLERILLAADDLGCRDLLA